MHKYHRPFIYVFSFNTYDLLWSGSSYWYNLTVRKGRFREIDDCAKICSSRRETGTISKGLGTSKQKSVLNLYFRTRCVSFTRWCQDGWFLGAGVCLLEPRREGSRVTLQGQCCWSQRELWKVSEEKAWCPGLQDWNLISTSLKK